MLSNAKHLRKNMTDAENRLWYHLRDRRLCGYKFIRQCVIGPYIVDFLCRNRKLIIELDGGQHAEAVEYDAKRTQFLENEKYRVFRVWNHEVFENVDGVLEGILRELENK